MSRITLRGTRVGAFAERTLRPIPRAVAQRRTGRRYSLADGFERVYLHHVRKTGGTSLSESFLALGGEDPRAVKQRLSEGWSVARSGEFAFAAHTRVALERGRYLFGWSHLPAWELDLPPRTFTVTILRDPAARVLSLYRYLADPGSDESQPYPAPAEERRIAAAGFDRFLDRLPEADLLGQLQMFSPARDPGEAAARIAECSLAFPLERLDAGLVTLSQLIGHHLAPRHERRSAQGFQPSPAQSARLREALAREYELFELLRP